MPRIIDKQEIFREANEVLVRNNWDLATPGRLVDNLYVYHGPDEAIRERTKEFARGLQKSEHLRIQLVGYVLEAFAHFYRSEESSFNKNWKHPDFSEYFQHWFYSDPTYVAHQPRACIERCFPCPKELKIRQGKSFWHNNS